MKQGQGPMKGINELTPGGDRGFVDNVITDCSAATD
jgi:hypothetical protein